MLSGSKNRKLKGEKNKCKRRKSLWKVLIKNKSKIKQKSRNRKRKKLNPKKKGLKKKNRRDQNFYYKTIKRWKKSRNKMKAMNKG